MCYSRGMTTTETDPFVIRAGAHAVHESLLRTYAQRFQHQVTDEDVAAILYGIEHDHLSPIKQRTGRWVLPAGWKVRPRHDPSTVIGEMVRTGLARDVREYDNHYLVPALVHLRDGEVSACRFTGEDMGPMRSRLTDDLILVDCLECERTVSTGHPRGL